MRRYYTLVERDGPKDAWYPQFGAYERSDVEFERQSMRDHGTKAANINIITSAPGKKEVEAAIAKLNAR
jgi:hypothetical protein